MPRKRTLAYLDPILDDFDNTVGYWLRVLDGPRYIITSHHELLKFMRRDNLDVYIFRILGNKGYLWFDEAVDDRLTESPILSESHRALTVLSFKSGTSKYKLVSKSVWSDDYNPLSMDFLRSLKVVFDLFPAAGVYPTPSSLGHAMMIIHWSDQSRGRIPRTNHFLRSKLFEYGSGGRADDFGLHEEGTRYESDIDNSYATQSKNGVPASPVEKLGIKNRFHSDLTVLEEYSVAFCQARITIPEDSNVKISPFYVRGPDNILQWENRPGTYIGYWWSPVLKRCRDAGYKVEIASSWCWRNLDLFLKPWAEDIVQKRQYLKELHLDEMIPKSWIKIIEYAAKMLKRAIVGGIGRLAMKNKVTYLISPSHYKEGDQEFMNEDADDTSELWTGYFTRTVMDYDSNALTHVAYYIVMMNNIMITDRMLAEEVNGNIVISSNFDAIFTVMPPTLPMNGWKLRIHHHHKQRANRSYSSDEAGLVAPGLAHERRKNVQVSGSART